MEIKRDFYLNKLIERRNSKAIKVIAGIRRCGKSYLVFNLYRDYLIKDGVNKDNIITFAFDDDDDIDKLDKYYENEPTKVLDPLTRTFKVNSKKFRAFIKDITNESEQYYILLDEIQQLENFPGTLNSLLKRENFDVYVTGSNSKLLSSDIITTFRGRGDIIKIYPLSFKEFFEAQNLSFDDCYRNFSYFGGMPYILSLNSEEQKSSYLSNLYSEIYVKDISERYKIKNEDSLERLINILASSIGSPCSPTSLENAFKSKIKVNYHHDTIKKHIDYLKDCFLISQVDRFDIKGKNYINSGSKYYFTDLGLRNVRLNFRQIEETHIMENIIYNELIIRGFNVDVGAIETIETNLNGNSVRKNIEVDFVCNQTDKKLYIQSAYMILDEAKMHQEERSLLKINDSFKKIIIVRNDVRTHYNDNGTLIISLKDFLLNNNSLNY